ncbi:Tn7 transposase TnsA N-terminal domain-containing protein [Zobellella taiwanensis]
MTTRRLDRYSRIKPSIAFFSLKNGRMLYAESRLERDALYHLEFDISVMRYVTQPDTFAYQLNGADRVYTPDILVEYDGGRFEFIEVKPEEKTKIEKFSAKFSLLHQLFETQLLTPLTVWSSSDIHAGERVKNYQRLYRYRRLPCPGEDARLLDEYLPSSFSFKQLVEQCSLLRLPATLPMQLLAHRCYRFEMELPLLPETQLRRQHARI